MTNRTTSRKTSQMIGGALIVLGILVALGGGTLLMRPQALPAQGKAGQTAADALYAQIETGLRTRARAIEPRAKAAAHLHELIAGVDLGADANTFDDLLTTEEWWAPYRTEFGVNGIVGLDGPLAMLGPALTDPVNAHVVRQAREEGTASGVASGRDGAFVLAGARIPRGKRGISGLVVLLGLPVDQTMLQAVAADPGIAVAIANDKRLLSTAGPESARPALLELLGKQTLGLSDLARGDRGGVWALADGVRLLAVLPAQAADKDPLSGKLALPILGAGAALLIIGLFLSIARGGRTDQPPMADPRARAPMASMIATPLPLLGADGEAQHDHVTTVVPQQAAAPAMAMAMPVAGMAVSGGAGTRATTGGGAASTAIAPQIGPGHLPANQATVAQRKTDVPGTGVKMGRYELLERIGEGGMAEVCIAAAHGAEGFVRRFVVKRMHPHLARNREAVNQFIDEARLQSGLVHSNIVPVYDFGKVGEEYFIALEYIHGRDLERVVRRHVEVFGRALSVPVAFFIVQEVLEALSYAHTRTDPTGALLDIVHRDVTPGNILLSFRGEVKLSDFGIAKGDRRLSKTELGTLKGNASFMSPEQARGEAVDARSDLFSAGVVLFYCLTGQFLYGDDDAMLKRLLRAAVGPATSELHQIDQIPDLAAAVIRRALAFDPRDRFQTARDFTRELIGHYTGGRSELADLMTELFPDERRESH